MKGDRGSGVFRLAVLQAIGFTLSTACTQSGVDHRESAPFEPGASGGTAPSAAPNDSAPPEGGDAGNVGHPPDSLGPIPECVEALPTLCANPPPSGQVDCDGDGVSAYLWCNGEDTFVPGWGDCDDTDPGRHQLVVYDPDGDGHATPSEQRRLCVGDTIPEHHAPPPGILEDCAEGDPDVHPDAVDPWGDGLDFDCDEFDPPRCANDPSTVPLEAPLSDACPDAPDVFVSMPIRWTCRDTYHQFFIGNRGHAPFEGTMRLRATGGSAQPIDPPTATITGPLAPGQTTGVLAWEGAHDADIVVELFGTDDAPLTDCDPTNQLVGHDGASGCSCK